MHSGIGYTALNKLFSCMDIPTPSIVAYTKYEREVGASIECVAQESCQRAVREEKQLVIENVEKLCNQL